MLRVIKNLPAPIIFCGSIAMNSIVEAGAQTQWWTEFPWLYITIFCGGMITWQIWDAIFTKDSSIKLLVKEARELYKLEGVQNIPTSNDAAVWLEPRIKIRFTKNVKNVKIVIKCNSCIGLRHARENFILLKKEFSQVYKDQVESFSIAILPIKKKIDDQTALGYMCWGDKYRASGDHIGMRTLHGNTENLIELYVHSNWKKQNDYFYMKVFKKDSFEVNQAYIITNNSDNIKVIPEKIN